MPQGTSTRLGRIMAGAPAVIPHDAAGQGLGGASHPPAQPLLPGLVASCPKVAVATGLSGGVIDRAGQARALARAWAHQDWGLLGMRAAHAPQGLASCAATREETRQDGPTVSRGPWKSPRAEEPRHGVRGAPGEGPPVVSWGTPSVTAPVAPTAWPQGDRARSERQATRWKRLRAHGALTTNEGRQTMRGAARHPPRVWEPLAHALEAAPQRVATQAQERTRPQAQGGASASQGHGTRLEHRQRPWAVLAKAPQDAPHPRGQRAAHAAAVGPPGERAARAGRPQTRRTVRTRLVAKALRSCMALLLGVLKTHGSLDGLVQRLLARSGARRETATQVG